IISEAVSAILDAKKTHDILEKYYAGNMDFEATQRLKDKVLERILEYR
ncbi:MAG: ATP-binding protein, partial [Clostridiales bacterium]|nr:ATP-binding protein [Clostridiales bacterium]